MEPTYGLAGVSDPTDDRIINAFRIRYVIGPFLKIRKEKMLQGLSDDVKAAFEDVAVDDVGSVYQEISGTSDRITARDSASRNKALAIATLQKTVQASDGGFAKMMFERAPYLNARGEASRLKTLRSVDVSSLLNMRSINGDGDGTILKTLRLVAEELSANYESRKDEFVSQVSKTIFNLPVQRQWKEYQTSGTEYGMSEAGKYVAVTEMLFSVGLLMTHVVRPNNSWEKELFRREYKEGVDDYYDKTMEEQSKYLRTLYNILNAVNKPPIYGRGLEDGTTLLTMRPFQLEEGMPRQTVADFLKEASTFFMSKANKFFVFYEAESMQVLPISSFYSTSGKSAPTRLGGEDFMSLMDGTDEALSVREKEACDDVCATALNASQLDFGSEEVKKYCNEMCDVGTEEKNCLRTAFLRTGMRDVEEGKAPSARQRSEAIAKFLLDFSSDQLSDCDERRSFAIDVCKKRVQNAIQNFDTGFKLVSKTETEFKDMVCNPRGIAWNTLPRVEDLNKPLAEEDARRLREFAEKRSSKLVGCRVAVDNCDASDKVVCFLASQVEGVREDRRYDSVRKACSAQVDDIVEKMKETTKNNFKSYLKEGKSCAALDLILKSVRGTGSPSELIVENLIAENCGTPTFTDFSTTDDAIQNVEKLRSSDPRPDMTREDFNAIRSSITKVSFDLLQRREISPLDALFLLIDRSFPTGEITRTNYSDFSQNPNYAYIEKVVSVNLREKIRENAIAYGYVSIAMDYMKSQVKYASDEFDKIEKACQEGLGKRSLAFDSGTRLNLIQNAPMKPLIVRTIFDGVEGLFKRVSAGSKLSVIRTLRLCKSMFKEVVRETDRHNNYDSWLGRQLNTRREDEDDGREEGDDGREDEDSAKKSARETAEVVVQQIDGDITPYWSSLLFGTFVTSDIFSVVAEKWEKQKEDFLKSPPSISNIRLSGILLIECGQRISFLVNHVEKMMVEPLSMVDFEYDNSLVRRAKEAQNEKIKRSKEKGTEEASDPGSSWIPWRSSSAKQPSYGSGMFTAAALASDPKALDAGTLRANVTPVDSQQVQTGAYPFQPFPAPPTNGTNKVNPSMSELLQRLQMNASRPSGSGDYYGPSRDITQDRPVDPETGERTPREGTGSARTAGGSGPGGGAEDARGSRWEGADRSGERARSGEAPTERWNGWDILGWTNLVVTNLPSSLREKIVKKFKKVTPKFVGERAVEIGLQAGGIAIDAGVAYQKLMSKDYKGAIMQGLNLISSVNEIADKWYKTEKGNSEENAEATKALQELDDKYNPIPFYAICFMSEVGAATLKLLIQAEDMPLVREYKFTETQEEPKTGFSASFETDDWANKEYYENYKDYEVDGNAQKFKNQYIVNTACALAAVGAFVWEKKVKVSPYDTKTIDSLLKLVSAADATTEYLDAFKPIERCSNSYAWGPMRWIMTDFKVKDEQSSDLLPYKVIEEQVNLCIDLAMCFYLVYKSLHAAGEVKVGGRKRVEKEKEKEWLASCFLRAMKYERKGDTLKLEIGKKADYNIEICFAKQEDILANKPNHLKLFNCDGSREAP